MHVECPYCEKQLNLKQVKPGRFKPKCSKCGKAFRLTIPDDPDGAPSVEPLEKKKASASTTVASQEAKSPDSRDSAATAVAHDSNQVGTAAAPEAGKTVALDQTVAAAPPTANPSALTASGELENESDNGSTVGAEPAPRTLANAEDQTAVVQRPNAPVPGGELLRAGQLVGGYRVEKELGRGAMGAVYLANQLSLDRLVGMKVIQSRFAADPIFIARFTREAYAAAQISHHNVVQIIDLGREKDLHYFTMEYVRGQTLDELIRERGKLDSEAAVGFILQAARGLQYAHNLGMVHRDIKPANLMLSETGAVKVADLGLVKMLRADGVNETKSDGAADTAVSLADVAGDVTDPNLSMGTPLFMAPEQGESAADVDHRADIYSLGCTFYVMLTGKPPFSGTSALEVITKHKSEPVTRPEIVAKRIPPELSDIVMRMVAKQPSDRYANLGELIADLEQFLGVRSGEPYSPDENDANELEAAVRAFNASKMAKLRGLLVPVCALAPVGQGLLCLPFSFSIGLGFAGMGVATAVSYFAIGGFRERTYLFDKVRQLLGQAKITDWLMWAGGALLALLVLYVLGILAPVLVLGLIGVGVGAGLHFVVDGMVKRERAESLEKVELLCRRLRLKGVQEDSLQLFIAKYSGKHWEEMFEAIFGYEDKLAARQELAKTEAGRRTARYRGWRDGVIRNINSRLAQASDSKQREHLQQIEEANLRAQGVNQNEAREQAMAMADALVDEAAGLRTQAVQSPAAATVVDPAAQREEKRRKQKAMLAEARSGKYKRKASPASSLLNLALGGKVRFLVGCLLIAGCVLWIQQNQIFSGEQIRDVANAALERDIDGATESLAAAEATATKPLAIPVVGGLFDSFNPGLIGLMLILSSFFRGWKMSIFALPAAAIAVLGPSLGVPGLGLGSHMISLIAGVGLCSLGFLLGRTAAPDEV